MNSRALAFSLLVSFGLPLLGVTPSTRALAQDDATTQEARKRFMEGVKLFDEKKYEQARAAFVQAYVLKKHPDVLLNLAQSELLSGHPLEAAQHFREFLRDSATEKHPKRPEAAKGLEEARMRLGRIQVTVEQADAEVFIDGKKVGSSPLAEAVEVAPGQHSVEVKKNGKVASQNINAPEGKITIVNLSVESSTPPPPATTVAPPPPASTPPPPPSAPPPPTAEPPRPPPTATAEEGSQTGERREPFMHWARRSPVAYTGAGLTLVGVGLGVGFAIAASIAQDNADTLSAKIRATAQNDQKLRAYPTPNGLVDRTGNPCADPIVTGDGGNYGKACTNLRNNLDAASSNRNVMTAGIVIGVLGVGTIVGGYFLTAKRSDTGSLPGPSLAISPVFGPSLSGLSAVGSF